jgi:hypothetical protein
MVFGMPRDRAHELLNECAAILRAGETIAVEVEDGRVLASNYKVVFKTVRPSAIPEYLGTARRYYGDRPFDAVVMFLPDRNHRFPWNPDYDYADAHEALSIV